MRAVRFSSVLGTVVLFAVALQWFVLHMLGATLAIARPVCVALFVRGHLFPYAAAVRHCQLMPSLHCHYIDLVPTSTCVLSFHTAAVCSSIHGQYLAIIVLMPTPCLHQVDVVHEQQISTYPAMECSMRKRSSVSTWTLKTMATK